MSARPRTMALDMSTLFPLPRLAEPKPFDPADEAANAAANMVVDRADDVPRPHRGPSADELLEGLNESQRRAVTYEGPACWWSPAPARARPGC